MTTNTAQLTLAANAARMEAFKAAVSRIETIMMPGARALAGTRTPGSSYWLDEERDLTGVAPLRGRVVLLWRDQGRAHHNNGTSAPYDITDDGEHRPSYSTQVIVPSDATPMELTELARLAMLYTVEIVRQCALKTASQVTALDSESMGFDSVAAE